MKNRRSRTAAGHSPEFKGVVKKIAGKLTSDEGLEREGREEMLEPRPGSPPESRVKGRKRSNPDPHRRG